MGGPIDLARLGGPAVRGYALKHGVSHQAAADAINWQATTLGHLGEFRLTLGERHVESEFLGPSETDSDLPELVLHVFLPTAADHAAAARFPGPGITRIEESVVTRLQMVQRIDEAEAAAREANPGRHLHTVFNHSTGEASVTVGEPYGWVLDGTCGGTNRETKGRLDGGRGFLRAAEDESCAIRGCTLGFSGYFNQKQGAVTAGHCVDDSPGGPGIDYSGIDRNGAFVCCGDHETWMMTYCYSPCAGVDNSRHWASLRPYFTYDSRALDAAFVREKFASTATSTNIYVAAGGFYNIIGFHDGSVSALGLTVCQAAGAPSSQNHGEHCGQVSDYSTTWQGTDGHYAEVEMFPNGTGGFQTGGLGSSGGPWYHKFQGPAGHDIIGLGVHAGHRVSATSVHSVFTRVDAIFDKFERHAALGLYCNYGEGKKLCRPVDLSHLFDWDQVAGQ